MLSGKWHNGMEKSLFPRARTPGSPLRLCLQLLCHQASFALWALIALLWKAFGATEYNLDSLTFPWPTHLQRWFLPPLLFFGTTQSVWNAISAVREGPRRREETQALT